MIDSLKDKNLVFHDFVEVNLPKFRNYKPSGKTKFSKWRYYRPDFFNGRIVLDDVNQGVFSGEYDIDIYDHRAPQIIKLSSDHIVMYLQGVEQLSLEKPFVKRDWFPDLKDTLQ